MKRLRNKLLSVKSKYDTVISEVEYEMASSVNFDFSVLYQPSDGFVVLNYETATNAPLNSCLDWIKENGSLSVDDHYGLGI